MTKDHYIAVATTAVMLREGQKCRYERLRAAGMSTPAEAASLMKVCGSTVGWISGGQCVGLAGPDETRFPRCQREPSVRSIIPLIGRSLRTQDSWQILDLLETPAPALEGLTPRMALERGAATEHVLAAAVGDAY